MKYLDEIYQNLKNRIKSALNEDLITDSRKLALNSIRKKHSDTIHQISPDSLKRSFRKIKEHAINDLSRLLKIATARLQENGCKIYFAGDAKDVYDILEGLIQENMVLKCKSNTLKEIQLTDYLKSRKIDVIETDLGDRIVQLSDSHPSHPLIPSLHIPKTEAAKLFGITTEPSQLTIKEIVNIARAGIRDLALKTNIGISGANAIAAEDGLICLEENEGNQRLITSLPRKHIVLVGIDKIVPTGEDAMQIMKSAAYFGLAMRSGVYLSFISGPSKTADIDFELTYGMHGPEEVHVIFLDNGRNKIIGKGYKELLYCANCGGCTNYCPVYEEIGGAFGDETFIGGQRLLYLSNSKNIEIGFQNGLNFCTGCQACNVACPGSIDTYNLMLKTRSEAIKNNFILSPHQKILDSIMEFSNPFSELKTNRSNWLINNSNQYSIKTDTLLFLGCMASYRMQNQAASTISLLNQLEIPFTYLGTEEPCCGGILRNCGFEEKFSANQTTVIQKLTDFQKIITICPGCYSTFMNAYADFFQESGTRVNHLVEILPKLSTRFKQIKKVVTYHDPCHLGRHFGIYDPPRTLLKNLGLTLHEMEYNRQNARCCGAGGGVLSSFPDLATQMARTRLNDAITVEAEHLLTSCPFCAYNLSQADTTFPISSIQEFIIFENLIKD